MKPSDAQDIIQTINEVVNQRTLFDNWEFYPGNSIQIGYFSGVTATNPSGNANVQYLRYLTNATVVFTQYFAWDANDNVITISTLPL